MRSRTERIGFLAVKLRAGMTPQSIFLWFFLFCFGKRKNPAGRAPKKHGGATALLSSPHHTNKKEGCAPHRTAPFFKKQKSY
jgi:hypothetical protein